MEQVVKLHTEQVQEFKDHQLEAATDINLTSANMPEEETEKINFI